MLTFLRVLREIDDTDMLTLKEHISEKLNKANLSLQKSIDKNQSCCHLKDIDFSGGHKPQYDNHDIQALYIMRYYGAYLCEYKWLYKNALDYLGDRNLNVLSIGCGCGLDSAGLYFEALDQDKNLQSIKYYGYDVVNWKDRDSFKNLSAKFIIKSVSNLQVFNRLNNIIIFPKSISDIDSSSFQEFINRLKDCDFKSSNIVLISSMRADKNYLNSDMERFQQIIEQFFNKGFSTDDEIDKYWYFSDAEKAWATLIPGFGIPDNIVNFLRKLSEKCPKFIKNKKSCKAECAKILDRWPILKVGTARYQLVRMKK